MIPEEAQAFIRSVKDGTGPGASRAPSTPTRRRGRPTDANHALAEALLPVLADPAARSRIAELQKRLAAEHAASRRAVQDAAAANSLALKQEVLALVAQRVKAAQALAALPPPPADAAPLYYLIQAPLLIWPTGVTLADEQTVDLQSYARFRVYTDMGEDSSGYVRFSYLWTNPFPESVFVNIAAFATWNGFCDVYLSGDLFSDDTAGSTVNAVLEVLPIWEPNATFMQQDVRNIFAARRQNGGFYAGFWEASVATHSGTALTMTDLLIPGTRSVFFTVTASLSAYVYEDGGASVDYSTAGYLFGSPAALITVTGKVVSP